jgi:CDP-paratose 2-epimerase
MRYKNILITGGAGFVGSNLAMQFKKTHPELSITALDNLKRRGSELNIARFKKAGVDFVHGDVRNKEDLKIVNDVDCIIDCAAEPSVLAGYDQGSDYIIRTNLIGTVNCLDMCREREAEFIFLSTSRVYPIGLINRIRVCESATRYSLLPDQELAGVTSSGISEQFSLNGYRSLYGASKLCSEILVAEYAQMYDMPSVINRCGVLTGAWQMAKVDQGVVALWVARHIYGGDLSYIGFGGLGKQVRDILHIDDLFGLLCKQIDKMESLRGDTFNIGGGNKNSLSLLELTSLCQTVTGKKIPINRAPETRPGDIKVYISDFKASSEIFDWIPRRACESIVADLAQWFQDHAAQLKPFFT